MGFCESWGRCFWVMATLFLTHKMTAPSGSRERERDVKTGCHFHVPSFTETPLIRFLYSVFTESYFSEFWFSLFLVLEFRFLGSLFFESRSFHNTFLLSNNIRECAVCGFRKVFRGKFYLKSHLSCTDKHPFRFKCRQVNECRKLFFHPYG